jgi:hypothetical protein
VTNITQNLWVRMVILKVLNGRKNQLPEVLHVPRLKKNKKINDTI